MKVTRLILIKKKTFAMDAVTIATLISSSLSLAITIVDKSFTFLDRIKSSNCCGNQVNFEDNSNNQQIVQNVTPKNK